MKKTIFSLLIFSAFINLNAEIIMPKVFSDNMLLQREMPVKVWGKAEANASVKVEFAGQSLEATACENGNWALYLEPMQANAKNQTMQISENGKSAKNIKNVLVGEVWVAGGQSNMVRSVSTTNHLNSIGDRANNPMLRVFCQEVHLMKTFSPVENKEDLTPNFDSPEGAGWHLATKQTTGNFGAVAFFFAERLITELKVPVAIIETPVGGSNMISWLAREDLTGIKTFEDGQKAFDDAIANYKAPKDVKAKKDSKKDAKKAKSKVKGVGSYRKLPSLMYNTKIAPLAGFTARGFIWYQGEADDTNPEFALMFERVVESWRKCWGDYVELDDGKLEKETMPFYAVQLPSYEPKGADWAKIRFQQFLVADKLDDAEIIITIDTGLENDIHPTDKDIVGARLGNLVLGETYDLKAYDDYDFPLLDEVEYKGSRVEVEFDTETDLKIVGAFRGFEVLVDKNWVAADLVELDEDKIVLKAKNNADVLGVRYLWKNWAKPDVCLYNQFNLPAMGFMDLKK